MTRLSLYCCLSALLCGVASAHAHDPDIEIIDVPEVSITGTRAVASSSEQFILDQDYLLQPQGRPAQVLRLIPGMITMEHSGGSGKADQYFLRGFDADHGTDVAFFTDGMPINFRSHAHGQGYTDLNFIIPETIERLEVSKGAYDLEVGDFATAGSVNFRTKEMVKDGALQLAGGQFATQRHLLIFSPTIDKVRSLIAAEGYYTNGPFQNPNRYFRGNLLSKVTMNPTGRSEISMTGTVHKSQGNASGEVPLRIVNDGTLDRFGSLDSSQGGNTTWSTARLNYHYDTPYKGRFFVNTYGQYYRFDLYSNFTVALNDSVNGDGIQQSDRRIVYGGDIGYRQAGTFLDLDSAVTVGVQTRVDDIHARLGTQVKRNPLHTTVDSDVQEASYAPFMKVEIQPASWIRLVGGVRGEVFTFDVRNRCLSCVAQSTGRTTSGVALPKANLILGPWGATELFMNYGEGFHSNDARAVVAAHSSSLARARTYEMGARSKPWGAAGIELSATVWAINLQSELVFSGDDGTTAIRGATARRGLEMGARGTVWGSLMFNGSFTWSRARFENGTQVPNAPELSAYGALLLRWPEGLSSQIQATYMGVRFLDESLKAPSWLDIDLSERYQLPLILSHGRMEAFLFVQNLFNTKWEQSTFAFTSRLASEPSSGVRDIHAVPGTPRFLMGGISWYF